MCITISGILTKLNVIYHIIAIYIQERFFDIPFNQLLSYSSEWTHSLIFRRSKGNNFSTPEHILMKLNWHHHTMVICTLYKFHEISSIACWFMAADRKKNSLTFWNPKEITPLLCRTSRTQPHHGNIFSMRFMRSHPLLTKLWLKMEKSLIFRRPKGNNFSSSDGIFMNFTCIITLWSYVLSISYTKYILLLADLWLRTEKNINIFKTHRTITNLVRKISWQNFTFITTP